MCRSLEGVHSLVGVLARVWSVHGPWVPGWAVEAMAVAVAVVLLAEVLRWSIGRGPLPGHAAWEGCVHDADIVVVGRWAPSALRGQL